MRRSSLIRFARLIVATALSFGASIASAQNISVTELRRDFSSVQAAVDAIGDGSGTIVLAPGTYRECAVQTRGQVTFRAAQAGTAIFDGVECEGKAALVLRGAGARVDGLIFQNMRVADLNGAGIRLEHSDLTVTNSVFRASEQGILTADDPEGTIRIDRSTFSRLGRCGDHPCAHSIYIGNYGQLIVTRSRFERGTGGHYVKTRAARVDISDSTFDDTLGTETNYMIDLSVGATGRISGNLFIQGENKENYSAYITISPEGRTHSAAGLTISDNRAGPAAGVERLTTFVADWSGGQPVMARNTLGTGLRAYERR
jgi:hypothetical protein